MSPTVATAISACLAAAPSFEHLDSTVEKLGFKEAGRENQDVRWTDIQGTEVFLSSVPRQMVCSVWFDGSATDETASLSELLQNHGYAARRLTDDQSGPLWLVGANWFVRLVVKQGNEHRLGAALFVLRN